MPAPIWPRACRICGDTHNLAKDKRSPGGVRTICVECRRPITNAAMARRRADPEKAARDRRRQAEWLQRNKERHRQYSAKWLQRSKKSAKPWQRSISAAVVAWRKSQGLTSEGLARMLGVSQTTISRRETCATLWPLADLAKLVALGAVFDPDDVGFLRAALAAKGRARV